jgi:UDPglucose 6-dehydrogenase
MVKYMTNCALVVKVALFNEFFAICGHLQNVNYESVRKMVVLDERIGASHTAVPGPDGDFGFGGKCFPKDLTALIGLAEQLETPHNILQGAWDTNLEMRWEQDWFKIPGATIEGKE